MNLEKIRYPRGPGSANGYDGPMSFVAISLGAGVQSSVMALMAKHGELTPMPDFAVFADTQAEPAHVYAWLDWLEDQLPFPVHRVTKGDLREAVLTGGSGSRFASPPFYTSNEHGEREGLLRRQCTREYKVEPIEKKLRELAGYESRQRIPPGTVEQWIGISLDEIQRMKDARTKWIVNRWPLIEKRMTRLHCLEWMRDHGYNELPQKSACTFCPYHDDATWQKMRDDDPASFEDACRIDDAVRSGFDKTTQQLYLHRSLIPLRDVDFTRPDVDQAQFDFMDECDGMCGV